MSDPAEYVLERIFEAPREMVWRAWTDPQLLNRWYGPGADTIIHEFDLKPGGYWLNEMKWGEKSMFQKMVFTQVDKPNKLVWRQHSSTDDEWNDVPMGGNWPRLLLTTVNFEDLGDTTNVRLAQKPMDATPEEVAGFTASMEGMSKGWGSGYAIMDEIFAELHSNDA